MLVGGKWHSQKVAMIRGKQRGGYTKAEHDAVSHALDEQYQPTGRAKPTKAEPGSPEKILVLCERLEKGQPLWHPADPIIDYPLLERPDWVGSYQGVKGDPKKLDWADLSV